MASHLDQKFMTRALELAQKGQGFVHPNPMVGCVVVRGGKVLAEGYHHAYGKDHAEVDALKKLGTRARGAALYVNLEPCAHWGKTPPCMIAVVAAGIREVVAAMRDPNPKVAGKGIAYLKQHGVKVRLGVLEAEALELNRAFVTRIKEQRPYVTIKAAVSLDGRMATVSGDSKWITGEPARKAGHRLRARVDAIAVGASTVLRDNPTLTTHGLGRNPIRMIFMGQRRISRRLNVFNRAATTWILNKTQGKKNLRLVLKALAQKGITHLLVEGGPTLQRSFLEAGCVDEVVWFIAPLMIGNVRKLRDAKAIKEMKAEFVGKDVCITGRVVR